MEDDIYGVYDWRLRTHLFYWAQRLSLIAAALLVLLTYFIDPKQNWSCVVVVAVIACVWTSLSVTVVVWLRMIMAGMFLEASLVKRHNAPTWLEGVKVVGWPGFKSFSILLRSLATLLLGYVSICVAYAVAYSAVRGVDSPGFPAALYFSFIASSTVGFGDVLPVGIGRLFSILQVLTGLIYAIMSIGSVGSIFSRVVTGLAPGLGVEEIDGKVVIQGVFIDRVGTQAENDGNDNK